MAFGSPHDDGYVLRPTCCVLTCDMLTCDMLTCD